jgi:hypothetical protein
LSNQGGASQRSGRCEPGQASHAGVPKELNVEPADGRALTGRLSAPGDKSISHRALLIAARAEGRSRIRGCPTARTSATRSRPSSRSARGRSAVGETSTWTAERPACTNRRP